MRFSVTFQTLFLHFSSVGVRGKIVTGHNPLYGIYEVPCTIFQVQNPCTPAHFKTSFLSKIPCATFSQKCRKNGHFSRKIPDFRGFSGEKKALFGRKLRARGTFFRDFFPGFSRRSRIWGVKRHPRKGKGSKNTTFFRGMILQGPDLGPGPGTPDLGGPNEHFPILRPPFLG